MRHLKLFVGLFVVLLAGSIALSAGSAKADSIIYLSHPSGGEYDNEPSAAATPQLNYGTITGWTIDPTGCANECAGAGASTITTGLFLNGTEVSSSTGGTGYSPATSTVSGIAIPFSPGDILSIEATWGYQTSGITGTITGSNLTNEAGYTIALSFLQPVGGSTIPDFSTWKMLGSGTPTDGVLYRFDVLYTQLGTSETYDDFNLAGSYFNPEEFDIPKSMALATGTEWYAQGFLYATSSTEDDLAAIDPGDAIATTSVIFFDVGTSTISTPSSSPPIASACPSAPPIFQLTGSLPYFVINNPIPSIISGGCNILSAGFIMSSDQTADVETRLTGAGNTLKTKPPIGYFALAIDDMGTLSLASSSTSSILDATSTAAIYGVYEPLDAGCATVIGFMLLLWFFNRGRHFQL